MNPFALRSPSTGWEKVIAGDSPERFVWIWFKPPSAPNGFIATLPAEGRQRAGGGEWLTMKGLLRAAGADPAAVAMFYLYGVLQTPIASGSVFDQLISVPPPEADPNIVVLMNAAAPTNQPAPLLLAETAPATSVSSAAVGGDLARNFDAIDTDWNASLQIEKQLALLRKQLSAILGRVSALDRDLSPEERLHGDRQEKNDWQEARRWLKDVAAKLSRYMKEYDTGDTSAAGKRDWFEQTYQQVIVHRRPVDGLPQMAKEFESYRKRLQILLTNMNSAHQNAAQEGERRAQQVLSRLAARVRGARSKRKWA